MAKGCTSCKKKKEITEPLPPVDYVDIYLPTIEEIKLAYAELTSQGGVREDKKDFINNVYIFLFGEPFNFNCRGCGNSQVRRFTNYVNSI